DGFRDSVECLGFNTNPWKIDGDRDNDRMPDAYEEYCMSRGGWQNPNIFNHRYAILYTPYIYPGPFASEPGFWLDTAIMRDILKFVYNYKDDYKRGFDPTTDEIAFLMSGFTPDGYDYLSYHLPMESLFREKYYDDVVIDDNANKDSISSIINKISPYADTSTFLFIFTFNHGHNFSDWNEPQEIPAVALCHDRTEMYPVDDPSAYIQDTEFSSLINQLPAAQRVIVMQQCFGGGFVDDFSTTNPKTAILTASSYMQYAWGSERGQECTYASGVGVVRCGHGEFLLTFFSAVKRYFAFHKCGGYNINFIEVEFYNADSDCNGLLSLSEIYHFITTHDAYYVNNPIHYEYAKEETQLDCDGNKVSQQGTKTQDGDWDDDQDVLHLYF
ncbi:MAG: hypothetical protein QW531_05700, partial [Thermoplasmata archaeon]